MSRSLSTAAKQAIFAQQTNETFLMLLTISHTDITTIRAVNNQEDITSNGDLYQAFPFRFTLPSEDEDILPQVTLQIDNVSKLLVAGVRSVASKLNVQLDVILADTPDTIEMGPLSFKMIQVNYDADLLTGTCNFHDILNQPYPAGSYVPPDYPGLF